ncbi:hypothetical protein [Pseudomonas sp. 34 E 7]|uniref:hypothetical protein n=1 Tax=Pseudomonas sp. 34 E 7 TaxID=1844102 RepID=UPI000811F3EE|nr:hypothetical protein [Pseudomonas sp. 34 E 7]CRN01187.1 hypothetical protein [Pseudomonas sp. 34 E 7]
MKEELIVPFVGAILTALIAGIVSLVMAILSKDQKTSEFRQAWIDALRDDISRFVGTAHSLVGAADIVNKKSNDEIKDYVLSISRDFAETSYLLSRIRLRLNVDEHTDILEAIAWLQDETTGGTKEEMLQKIETLVVRIQEELKKEWERVKAGEKSFRVLKITSAVVVISLATAMAGYVLSPLLGKGLW